METTSDNQTTQPIQTTQNNKPKPKLRSVPKATRVILRQHGKKCSQVVIMDGIFSRYDLIDNEHKRNHIKKLLKRALDKATNETMDIKRHKNSFSLIAKKDVKTNTKINKVKKSKASTQSGQPTQPTQSAQPIETNETNQQSSHKWQYFDNGWFDYHTEASKLVEEAYQDYIAHPGMWDVRAVKSGRWQYQVDFPNMKQTNIEHDDHTQRDIRRIAV